MIRNLKVLSICIFLLLSIYQNDALNKTSPANLTTLDSAQQSEKSPELTSMDRLNEMMMDELDNFDSDEMDGFTFDESDDFFF
ncbi:hypothetical protein BpHYR1_000825 [Brachionus plicatilis]|uniref:Uncharacterized protein n=1 Tax=Brachionus plicatilis TaxID=10195 RepID=A0A3M7QJ31_BRAPC|nr:hypothetical protein BpHYR1_000825 [Brachionus plicatilis]